MQLSERPLTDIDTLSSNCYVVSETQCMMFSGTDSLKQRSFWFYIIEEVVILSIALKGIISIKDILPIIKAYFFAAFPSAIRSTKYIIGINFLGFHYFPAR